mgnify:CR=1 FL=1
MKQFILALIFVLIVPVSAFSQTCVKVDSVYSTMKIKEFKDIKAPLKNINLELLGFKEKYNIHNETSVTSSQKK